PVGELVATFDHLASLRMRHPGGEIHCAGTSKQQQLSLTMADEVTSHENGHILRPSTTPLPSSLALWLVARLLLPLAQLLHAGLDLRLVAAVGRLVILDVRRDVFLIDPAAREVVGVLVLRPMAELLRALVMRVLQVLGHRQRAALLHVLR